MNNHSNINLLIYMLEDIRRVTLKGVSGLTKEQLFREPVQGEFCIGSYLMHLAEVDLGWLQIMNGKEIDEELKLRAYYGTWFDSDTACKPPTEPLEMEEYHDTMAQCRAKVIEYIKSLSDADLEEKFTVLRKYGEKEVKKEYTRKWIIYHLIEHEAHTRGQMFLLIRKAWFKAKGENN